MSLKAFHIAFIAISSALAFGFAAWEWNQFQISRGGIDLVSAGFSLLAGITLIAYGARFLKKLRHVSYI